ncbi:hypothetical protein [Levilactobacillus yiduensis]|uniref:hypothetical protein n=1 Tax=Levilactobacillus yiduensis TaxID=2953880 RepID=UPI001AD8377E|nr:hypothetical protein [Levilactobacillus yiduensis]
MTNTYSDEYLVSMDADSKHYDNRVVRFRYSLTIEKKNQQLNWITEAADGFKRYRN